MEQNNFTKTSKTWLGAGLQIRTLTAFLVAMVMFLGSTNAQSYIRTVCNSAFEDIAATGTLLGTGDDPMFNLTMSFPFTYWGVTSSQLRVSTNGAFSFNDLAYTFPFTNAAVAVQTPARIIPFWDDLNSSASGGIRYQTMGVAPNRRFIIQWNSPQFGGTVGDEIAVQAVLFETTQEIQFRYADPNFNSVAGGGSATVGINGTLAGQLDQYSFNTNSLTVGQCISYAPAVCVLTCPANVTVNNTPGLCGANMVFAPVTGVGASCPSATIVNNFNAGGANASGFYPVGTTNVTFSGNGISQPCTFSVTVIDTEAPVFVCPANTTINLQGGECSAVFSYNISATDNCAPVNLTFNQNVNINQLNVAGSLSCGPAAINRYGRVFAGPGSPLPLTNIRLGRNFDPGQPNGGMWTVRFYSLNGSPLSYANYTLIAAMAPFAPPAAAGFFNTPITGITIPAGGQFVVEVETSNPYTIGQSNAGETGPSYLQAPACGFANPITFASIGFANFQIQMQVTGLQPLILQQIAGLPSGGLFPLGTTTQIWQAVDPSGNVGTCTFSVTVNEWPFPVLSLACNDNVQISLDENCEAAITADMILEGGPYACYDRYAVTIQGLPSNVVGAPQIGQTLNVTVTDTETGNNCWGTITVEDKIPPALDCPDDVTIDCGIDPIPGTTFDVDLGFTATNGPINDNGTTNFSIPVSLPAGALLGFSADIEFNHTWIGDVDVALIAPGGQTAILFDRPGVPASAFGCTGPNMDVRFKDGAAGTAAQLEASCTPPAIAGEFQPVQPLSGLTGGNLNGNWTVRFRDNFAGDAGTTVNLQLNFRIQGGGSIAFPNDLTLNQTVFATPGVPRHYTVPAGLLDACTVTDLSYQDQITNNECVGPNWRTIVRTWTAVDASGNSATCSHTINVRRSTIATVTVPPNYDNIDLPALACDGFWDLNGNNYPDPSETGGLVGTNCNIQGAYTDIVINVCDGTYKILRRWTLLDWCTGQVGESFQIIKVMDTVAPTVICPPNLTLSTSQYDCKANGFLPPATVSDNCSGTINVVTTGPGGLTLNSNGGPVFGLPIGNHTIVYTATDGCGNVSSCSMTLTVKDEIKPEAICDQHTTVALLQDGRARVFATTFDDGSWDNCAIDSFSVRRMTPVPACGINTQFRKYVDFCCADVATSPVQVVFRVYDKSGNFNECMVFVTVQDKTPPVIVCPPDLTIDCDYPFDVWDLSGFGSVRTLESDRKNIWLKTKKLVNLPNGNCDYQYIDSVLVGKDGIAFDNCNVTITVTEVVDVDNCGEGEIRRTFRATDAGGLSSSCTQIISVVNYDPFNGDEDVVGWDTYDQFLDQQYNNDCQHDIYWPLDYDATTCGEALNPENLPDGYNHPFINEDACDLVGVGYDDWYFDIQGDACLKIIRRWKVIDWCQYNDETGEYYFWMYDQIIKVKNTIPPVFDVCEDLTICTYDPNCSPAFITLTQSATDDCTPTEDLHWTYKIDLWNDGTYDIANGVGNDASGSYPLNVPDVTKPGAYHRILWTVEDGCGNKVTCEKRFRVIDCKVPTPVCYNGLAADLMPVDTDGDGIPDSGMVTIWAVDFDASSFDYCTDNEDLIFSFSADTLEKGMTFDCADLGTNIVQMWVTDEYGNQDYCETYIIIQDNNLVCNGTSKAIVGDIQTEGVQGVEDADVTIKAPGLPDFVGKTNVAGKYTALRPVNADYTIQATRTDNPMNGVSTHDIVFIQKHILNVLPLNTIGKLVAADVNKSGTVTAADLVELRKLILGKITVFSNNNSWRMIVNNGATTLAQVTEVRTVNDLDQDMINEDFLGVKIGDVNGSAKANSSFVSTEGRSGQVLNLNVAEQSVVAGQNYSVAFTAANFEAISGYQFTLNFDANALSFAGIEAGKLDVTEDNFGLTMLDKGMITTSWNQTEGVKAEANEVLFTLNFTAKSNGTISNMLRASSDYTTAEAYNGAGQVMNLNLNFTGVNNSYELFQNVPNPFVKSTVVGFNLPESMRGKITVYDVTGKVLKVVEQTFNKGNNQVSFTRSELATTGVLYYTLETADYTATKKMIILD